MSATQQYLYRQFFRLRVHESSGDAFQLLFSRIMSYANPEFKSVAPWGNWGDGGNDGWIESEAHYFQVYGPKPTTKIKDTEAVNKAIGDFDKLPKKWGVVKKYSFVMNDRFNGVPAPIASALQKLKKDKGLLHTGTICGMELLQTFMVLPEVDVRQDIIGGVPGEIAEFIDPRAIGELLTYLSEKAAPGLSFLCETAPEFDKKIEINGIGKVVRTRLESNSYQAHTINEFLDSSDDGLKQAIAKEINDTYAQSKSVISNSVEDAADLRYFWMVDKLIPPVMHEHLHSLAAFRTAAELVLAKYFETCDAYEHPNNVTTA